MLVDTVTTVFSSGNQRSIHLLVGDIATKWKTGANQRGQTMEIAPPSQILIVCTFFFFLDHDNNLLKENIVLDILPSVRILKNYLYGSGRRQPCHPKLIVVVNVHCQLHFVLPISLQFHYFQYYLSTNSDLQITLDAVNSSVAAQVVDELIYVLYIILVGEKNM